jgi:hypothetical protein
MARPLGLSNRNVLNTRWARASRLSERSTCNDFEASTPTRPATRNAAPLRQEVTTEAGKLETSGLAVTYVVAEPISVPSDGEPHQTNLSQIKLNGDLSYVCAPKLELAAFVKVHLTNSSDDTFLAGDVSLFRDGDLIGSLHLPEIVPGQ